MKIYNENNKQKSTSKSKKNDEVSENHDEEKIDNENNVESKEKPKTIGIKKK